MTRTVAALLGVALGAVLTAAAMIWALLPPQPSASDLTHARAVATAHYAHTHREGRP